MTPTPDPNAAPPTQPGEEGDQGPKKIAKYELRRKLGRGAAGVVYEGFDPFLQRQVAIKIARLELSRDREQARRYLTAFFNEAHIAGQLIHPHIVSIHDAGIEGALRYIVMEYVQGKTLDRFARAEKLLPMDKVVDTVFKCCRALHYAHGKGVVHRDIKPANLILSDEDVPKLLDFGIARLSVDPTPEEGNLQGTPAYMAPEQIAGRPASPQSDLYSLGAVMYELLSGERPYLGESVHSTLYKIVNEPYVPLKELRPEIPGVLVNIVDRALEKDPRNRYQTALELSTDLSRAFTTLRQQEAHIADREKFNILKTLKFFRDFQDGEIEEVVRAGIWLTHSPNSKIISEGDVENAFYIIAVGEAVVIKGKKVVGVLSHGDCFGEMGYLTKTQRSASVVSRSSTLLLKVSATLMEQASMNTQFRFQRVFLETLIERLSRSTERIAQE